MLPPKRNLSALMLSLACRSARHRLNPPALYIRTYRWTGSSAFAQRPGCRPPPLSSHPPSPRRDQAYPSHGTSVRLLFPFSTLNTTTRVRHNPKLDDDGNPMLINISPQAAKIGPTQCCPRTVSPSGSGDSSAMGLEGSRAARYRARRPNVARCSSQAPSRRVPPQPAAGASARREGGVGRVTSRDIARRRAVSRGHKAALRANPPGRPPARPPFVRPASSNLGRVLQIQDGHLLLRPCHHHLATAALPTCPHPTHRGRPTGWTAGTGPRNPRKPKSTTDTPLIPRSALLRA
ncbi:predicted protein [Histoplasma capsulatum H143]|uniref:Uncharacterized protein n=1 Tax=Ajellomyces capsulatus (strain H143) TaxID=544712 RepID=C6HDY1_AJECH|nr:predicted protein [Histoplasma capsulatum H143]